MSSVNQRIFGRFLYGSSGSTLTDVIVESSRERIPNSGSLVLEYSAAVTAVFVLSLVVLSVARLVLFLLLVYSIDKPKSNS